MIKKHVNKNLFAPQKDEKSFNSSNKCWICDKPFNVRDDKTRDHCHVTGKYRDSAPGSNR